MTRQTHGPARGPAGAPLQEKQGPVLPRLTPPLQGMPSGTRRGPSGSLGSPPPRVPPYPSPTHRAVGARSGLRAGPGPRPPVGLGGGAEPAPPCPLHAGGCSPPPGPPRRPRAPASRSGSDAYAREPAATGSCLREAHPHRSAAEPGGTRRQGQGQNAGLCSSSIFIVTENG